MPKYQYACPDCGEEFEATQKFTDKPLKKCPTCGKRNVYRAIRQVAVSFKGSGFYVNDSKSSDNKKTAKPKADEKATETSGEATAPKDGATAEATPTTAEAPKVDGKTETKSEAKTEPKEAKKDKKSKSAE